MGSTLEQTTEKGAPPPVETAPIALRPVVPPWHLLSSDRLWFLLIFAASTFAVMALFWPFRYVLLIATMIVVVSQPVFQRINRWMGGRRAIASALTTLALFILVFTPLAFLFRLAFSEAAPLLERMQSALDDPQYMDAITGRLNTWRMRAPASLHDYFPTEREFVSSVRGALKSLVNDSVALASNAVPNILAAFLGLGIHVLIFLFAVVTLYIEGPALRRFVTRISPMDDGYDQRLFEVFARFAHNVILASLATALLQGAVAAIGYRIAGIDRVVFLGILTGLGAFVPIIGTAAVWVPVTIAVYIDQGTGWAVFVALWSMIVTASVDNILKPFLVRGNSGIHPLLIFLGLFGGLAWMGVPGLIGGPVLVAMFLALYEIYVHDFLLEPTPTPLPPLDPAPSTVAPRGTDPERQPT